MLGSRKPLASSARQEEITVPRNYESTAIRPSFFVFAFQVIRTALTIVAPSQVYLPRGQV